MTPRNLYQPGAVRDIEQRLTRLERAREPLWGRMKPAQALAHCSLGLEMALGEFKPRRKLLGLVFGRMAKRSLIDRGEPMRRNAPTTAEMIVSDERDFDAERDRLLRTMVRFATGGSALCTTHPHLFLGRLTAREWATLMYAHLDHHLRQFDA